MSPSRARTSATVRGPIRVRRASLEDLELLVDHRQRMWADMGTYRPREIDAAGARSRTWIRKEMRAGRYLAFKAVASSGEVAGSGAIWLHPVQPFPGPRPRPDAPYILSMYTAPPYRRRGVASRLVREMLRWARQHGYRRVTLHASAFGRPVYRALGFDEGNEMRFNLISFAGMPASSPSRAGRPAKHSG